MRSSLIEQLARDQRLAALVQKQYPVAPSTPSADPLGEALAEVRRLNDRVASIEAQRMQAPGYTVEGLAALQQFMAERGLVDIAVGVREFERHNPAPEPLMTSGPRFGPPPAPRPPVSLDPLFNGHEDDFLGPAIADALAEVRGQ